MSELRLKIMVNACRIRVLGGEDLEEVLDSYPKLTENDKEYIRAELKEITDGE